MRHFAIAAATVALLAISGPVSAETFNATDLSAQSVTVDPGVGVGLRVGHDRFQSRRRDRERVIVRDRRPSCKTVTIRERTPSGATRITKRKSCD
jgi:hypothetical protein